jgi:transposase
MLVKGYWAEPLMDRQRTKIFIPTLDAMIDHDDPVRLVDEVLDGVDWTDWEAHYNGHRGQPPIHPRYIAGAMLYGMYRGIRSSRKLEEACHYRFDFIWLVEGQHIDHSTFAKFRTKFREPLKGLFRQIGRIAMTYRRDVGIDPLGRSRL